MTTGEIFAECGERGCAYRVEEDLDRFGWRVMHGGNGEALLRVPHFVAKKKGVVGRYVHLWLSRVHRYEDNLKMADDSGQQAAA